jgi:hypothetical protein
MKITLQTVLGTVSLLGLVFSLCNVSKGESYKNSKNLSLYESMSHIGSGYVCNTTICVRTYEPQCTNYEISYGSPPVTETHSTRFFFNPGKQCGFDPSSSQIFCFQFPVWCRITNNYGVSCEEWSDEEPIQSTVQDASRCD